MKERAGGKFGTARLRGSLQDPLWDQEGNTETVKASSAFGLDLWSLLVPVSGAMSNAWEPEKAPGRTAGAGVRVLLTATTLWM